MISLTEKVCNLGTTEEKFWLLPVIYIMERSDGTQTACVPFVETMGDNAFLGYT